MDEMVLDAAGPNFDQNMQEPPNAEASSFFQGMMNVQDVWLLQVKNARVVVVQMY
jgi:hypothetical protein